ncbi:hypothetical protein ACQPZX_36240 [Actinoplanes sp. CA-142083]|uniref:hypothetical protein n=1 Tax=Actinoplanes sp. CA-142083 TaxID=3239903 RepID=UPI003D9265C3
MTLLDGAQPTVKAVGRVFPGVASPPDGMAATRVTSPASPDIRANRPDGTARPHVAAKAAGAAPTRARARAGVATRARARAGVATQVSAQVGVATRVRARAGTARPTMVARVVAGDHRI